MHRRPWRGSDKAQTTKAVPHILKITKPKGFRVEFRLEPSNGESQGLRHHPTLSTSRGPATKRTLRNEYGFSFLHSVALKCLFLPSQSGSFLLSSWGPLYVGLLAHSEAILGTPTKRMTWIQRVDSHVQSGSVLVAAIISSMGKSNEVIIGDLGVNLPVLQQSQKPLAE